MIIGPDFVWLHFPKCAGTAFESALHSIFSARDDVVFDPIDPANVIWHHTIEQRQKYDPSFRLGSRKVTCCIRRLPSWVLSKTYFEIERAPKHLIGTRDMIIEGKTFEADGQISAADSYAREFAQPRVDHWIRMENLLEDTASAFGIEQSVFEEALAVKNKTRADYVKDLRFWFTADELAHLYDVNPIWAAIEKDVYGGPLTLK